jgi:hypothetical protein
MEERQDSESCNTRYRDLHGERLFYPDVDQDLRDETCNCGCQREQPCYSQQVGSGRATCDVQCHITQRHERRAPYTSNKLAELLSNSPCFMGSAFRDARTGISPNSSVRTRELIVALQLKKSALYENANNACRAARVCGCV